MALDIGMRAPEIGVTDQDGKTVKLSDFAGKNVVLYFYPKDDTPGCTVEACEFRDNLGQFADAQTVILGVSTDNEASHQAFIKKYGLNFTLLVDKNQELAEAFGVLGQGGYANRSTFLLDKTGTVRKVFHKVNPKGHSGEVREALTTL